MNALATKRAELTRKQTEFKTLYDEGKASGTHRRESLEKMQRLNTEMSDLVAEIDVLKSLDEMDRDGKSGGRPIIDDGTPGIAAKTVDAPRLGREQKMVDVVKQQTGIDGSQFSFGEYVKGIYTGEWKTPQLKAMSIGTATAGGHMVPTPLASYIIDLARARARVLQAGAQTVPLTSDTLKIAKVVDDPTLYWHAENTSDITASDYTLGAVTFNAKSLAAKIVMSRELLEDAQNLDDLIPGMLAKAFAGEIDRVALYGAGTNEPTGLINQSGFESVAYATPDGAVLANTTAYSKLLEAILNVEDSGYDVTGMIGSPRVINDLYGLQDANNQPLQPPAKIANIPFYSTTQVLNTETLGASSDTSRIFVGEWDRLMIGIRTSFQVALREDSTLDSSGQVAFFAWMRADVQPTDIDAFSSVHGIK